MSILFHLVADISSSLIAHDAVLAVKMIFDSDPLPEFVRCFRPAFNDNSDCFMTWNERKRGDRSSDVVPFPQVDVRPADGNRRDFYLTLILIV